MPTITLPDGNNLDFPKKVTGLEVAEKISKSLAKQAMVISVDGELKDLDFIIDKNCSVKIFTSKNDEGLETIRHDTAHILAMAVQELFPGTQVTIGPVIQNGFYYDFARKEPFTEEDLKNIEDKMKEIVDRDEKTKREVWDRDKAIKHFKKKGEIYKAELIESIPKSEEVSIYFHGDWHDLCRGPHLSSTGKIGKHFKLTKVAGAYWRGDSKNEMLQRIYGTAWKNNQDLEKHLTIIREAEKRDHRVLGKNMDLFHFQEEAPGAVFWHPKGWKVFQKLINYMRDKQEKAGYLEINTPEVLDRVLLFNYYLIPQFHIGHYRVAYWNKISKPEVSPKYDLGFDFWWFDPKKAGSMGEIPSPSNDKKNNKDSSIHYLLLIFLLFILWKIRRKTS